MNRELSPAAHNVIRTAVEFAREHGSEDVEPEHILLALLSDPDAAVTELLQRANPTSGNGLPSTADHILRELERRLSSADEFTARGRIPLSPIAQRTVEFAGEEAEGCDADLVEPPHLLIGLIREQRGIAAEILLDMSYTIESLRAELDTPNSQGEAPAEPRSEPSPTHSIANDDSPPPPVDHPGKRVNGSHEGLAESFIDAEFDLTYREYADDARVYIPRNEGWQAHLKQGWDQLYCYLKHPDEEAFHLILNGEVFLQRGDEKFCLNCALRHGVATSDRLYWQRRKRKQEKE